MTQRC